MRNRHQVLAAAESVVPGAEFDCRDYSPETEACRNTVDPGWVTIVFGASGMLGEVRLDG